MPILYAPWFQFPIDDRRRTGLLFPTFGESSKTGFDVRQPVYFNLAPNYDATLTPRYMSERGLQLDADGRYLLRRSEGRVGYEVLEDRELDDETRAYTELEPGLRGTLHEPSWSPNDALRARIRVTASSSRREVIIPFSTPAFIKP